MKNKRVKFILMLVILCSVFMAVGIITGCSEQTGDSGGDDTPSQTVDYIIDVSTVEYAVGEVGEVYTIPQPKVIDRSGNEASGFTVRVDYVKNNASDKEYIVAARRFTPDATGKYTIGYTCGNESVRDATAEITVGDTQDPEINITAASSFVFTGESTPVPKFEANDAGGIDEAKTYVKIYDSNNSEIIPDGEIFVLNAVGVYKYEFTATDLSGNTVTETMNVTATDETRREGGLTYWSEDSYSAQISKYCDSTMPEIEWDAQFKDPDGNETLSVTATGEERYCAFALNCAITDWSEYDYIGFWVYNPTDLVMTAGFIQIAAEDTYVLKPNAWTFICLGAHSDSYIDANKNVDRHTDRNQIVFAIYDRYWDKVAQTVGTEYHVSNMNLYKHGDETDDVLGFGGKEGILYIGMNEGYMEMYAESVTDNVLGEDEYALKLTKLEKSQKEGDLVGLNFWYRNYIERNFNTQSRYYTLNVYNPNEYDIILIDNDAWGTSSEGENYSTVIKAGESGEVLIQIRDKNVNYFCAFRYDSAKAGSTEAVSSLTMGDSIYIGSIRTSDNVTDQTVIDAWNQTHGDAVAAEIFG